MEGQIGIDIVLWFQSWRFPWVTTLFLPFHWMGASAFYLVCLPLLYWCVDAQVGRRAILGFLGAAWANGWLKALFDLPRPPEVSALVLPAVESGGSGLPSGHTMTATVLWSLVALGLRRRWVTALAACVIVLMGVSRVVHGVHFPSDVIAGWGFGGLIVVGVVWLEPPVSRFWMSISGFEKSAVVVGVVVVLLLICPVLTPPGARSSSGQVVAVAGALLGAAQGIVLERARLGFDVEGAWRQRGVRYFVGVVTVGVVHVALTLLAARVAPEPGIIEATVRFSRYALVGLWLVAGAPWLLTRAGLLSCVPPHARTT